MLRTKQQGMPSEDSNVKILSRLSALPTVNFALEFAYGTYTKTKDRNALLKYALGAAEKSIFAVAKTAEPVVKRLHNQIHVVDDFACKALDKLEETLPVVKKTPEEVVAAANILSTASYGQLVTKQVNKGLDVADSCIGYMLSVPDKTTHSEGETVENPVTKTLLIYHKVMNHAFKNTASQVTEFGKHVRDSLANLNFAIIMMEYLKTANMNLSSEKVNHTINDAKERVNTIWLALNEDDDSHISEKKNLVEKLLYLSRRLTKQLIFSVNYIVSTSQCLPESINDRLKVSQEYLSDMSSYFTKATGVEEFNNFADQFKPKFEYVQNSLIKISKHPVISQVLSMLVPKNTVELSPMNENMGSSNSSDDDKD